MGHPNKEPTMTTSSATLDTMPEFNDIQYRASNDWRFCKDHPEEFQRLGRFSITCAMRTVVSMNAKMTRKEFIEIFEYMGFNKSTLGIQFAKSRKFDVKCYGKTLNKDGSFSK
jgi:hypothetical protein